MKIAIIAHSLYPISEPYAGGLEMITHLLCRALQNKGHQVDLYALETDDRSLNFLPLFDFPRVKSDRFEDRKLEEITAYSKTYFEIQKKGYDVIHNNSLHFQPIVLGNESETPFITTIHVPKITWLTPGIKIIKGAINQTFTMVSNALGSVWKDDIPTYEVIHNGIDLDAWQFSDTPINDQLLWYGRICPEKGTEEAIQIAIQNNYKLKIAGPISHKEYYEESVEPYLDHPLITYVGHANQAAISQLLQNSFATLFTSVWEEPYGLVIAESLASGTPVLAYSLGAAPEILNSKCGMLINQNDPESATTALKYLKRIDRKACRYRAETCCSHHVMVAKYEALYLDLVANKSAQRLSLVS